MVARSASSKQTMFGCAKNSANILMFGPDVLMCSSLFLHLVRAVVQDLLVQGMTKVNRVGVR